ncbi:MFS transporter [Chondromyces crocatus]|uniref:MFS transporter n=1 Tax=Chondromyces crocatus TaxID=52 RepID=A0A0K1EMB9_CHOCO|nr:MFS transporter [Chondromyces crocatus]AKT41797.1 MFS transporter [Chondromyces crocatus]
MQPTTPTAPPSQQPAPAPAEEQAGKWTVLAIVAIGVVMATLDTSIVNISLPAIAAHFHVPLSGAIAWVIIAYLVVLAALTLTAGRLADMFGRKAVWIAGLALFTTSSALCGAATSLGMLVAFRGLQGIGGALLMAVSPAMLTRAFPPSERGRALGLNAVFVALGVSAGPTLGGLITAHLSWRYIFYVNVPVGALGILASLTLLTERLRRSHSRFDFPGACLLGGGLAALTGGLSFGQELGWRSPLLLGLLGTALLLLGVLLVHERRHPAPLIDLTLFRHRVFASSSVSLVLSFFALFGGSIMMPFYLEQLRGFSVQTSGLLITPLPLTLAVVAPLSGSLADRLGSRWLTAAGLSLGCAGLLLTGNLDARSSISAIVGSLVVTAIGQGLFQAPNNSALLGAAPTDKQGVASGLLATGRVIGQSMSVALAGAIFPSLGGAFAGHELTRLRESGATPERMAPLEATFSTAFRTTFLVFAAIASLGVLATLVRGREGRRARP